MDETPTDPSFWTPLGGYTDPASLPNSADDDSVAPSLPKSLFRISDTGGAVTFIEVTPSSSKLTKELLVSSDVFLLQSSGKIYLWIGKGASLAEKKEATPRALQVRVSPPLLSADIHPPPPPSHSASSPHCSISPRKACPRPP